MSTVDVDATELFHWLTVLTSIITDVFITPYYINMLNLLEHHCSKCHLIQGSTVIPLVCHLLQDLKVPSSRFDKD